MYQHNWAALVNTDAAFLFCKGDERKKEQLNNHLSLILLHNIYARKILVKICSNINKNTKCININALAGILL